MLSWFAKRSLVEVNAFSCTSEKEMHNFTLFWTTAAVQNDDFQTFLDFEKNYSALGYFNYVFENNPLKGLFGQSKKKLKILKLSQDSRYLQTVAHK